MFIRYGGSLGATNRHTLDKQTKETVSVFALLEKDFQEWNEVY